MGRAAFTPGGHDPVATPALPVCVGTDAVQVGVTDTVIGDGSALAPTRNRQEAR